MSEETLHIGPPSGYSAMSAVQKLDVVWEDMILPTKHLLTELPSQRLPFQEKPLVAAQVILKRDELEKALTRTDDFMEPGRPKIIHGVGSTAKVELEINPDSPFTGLLGPSSHQRAIGLLRMSLVGAVGPRMAYTPALALKLFVDGQPSCDLLAMNHTVGQGRDHNMFSNTMTTDLTHAHNELRPPQKVMKIFFNRVSHEPRRLTVDHFCRQGRDGALVDTAIAPDRLIFSPKQGPSAAFVKQEGVDFRRVLGSLEPGTVLYDVLAVSGSDAVPLGELRTASRFVSSDAGDRLYFRHVQRPKDRKH